MTINCPYCHRPLPDDDLLARRGTLINEVASLGGRIVELTIRCRLPFKSDGERVAALEALEDLRAEHEMKNALLKAMVTK